MIVVLALPAQAQTADIPCTCRAQGVDYEVGTTVCLATPSGPRQATCGMVLNNTSWSFGAPCGLSGGSSFYALSMPSAQTDSSDR
jgi:hypothetical protein